MEELKSKFKNKTYLNYDTTLELSQKKLTEKKLTERTLQDICSCAAVQLDESTEEFIVMFLNQEYRVKYQTGEVYHPQGIEIPLDTQILIVHYLYYAEGTPLKNEPISFKELPSGQIYINPYTNRVIRPLTKYFGSNAQDLLKAGAYFGGKPREYGDASITIDVFPRVPVTYIVWEGDDEFPASGNVLFDAVAPDYLPTEDYTVISSKVIYEMKKILDQQEES